MGAFSFPFGIQMLLDANQQLYTDNVPVFLVIENYKQADFQDITDIGLSYSGDVPNENPGSQDIQILPPPQVSELTLKDISSSAQSNADLKIGSIRFTVSQTWVANAQQQFDFDEGYQVWKDDSVSGIRYHGILYDIVDAIPNKGFSSILSWDVYCNAPMRQGDAK